MYYLCSENKGTDQLILCLCFRICKMLVFHDAAHIHTFSVLKGFVINLIILLASFPCRFKRWVSFVLSQILIKEFLPALALIVCYPRQALNLYATAVFKSLYANTDFDGVLIL